jgi:hypothetical protein
MLPEVTALVAGPGLEAVPARLAGYRRCRLRGAVYPGLLPVAGALTEGVLWRGLDARSLARVDRFEGELYVRALVGVEVAGGVVREAFVYVLSAVHRALACEAPWDEREFRALHLDAYLAACRAFAREPS